MFLSMLQNASALVSVLLTAFKSPGPGIAFVLLVGNPQIAAAITEVPAHYSCPVQDG